MEVPPTGPAQAIAHPKSRTPKPYKWGPAEGGGLYRHDLAKQGRPGRIGSVARRLHLVLVAPRQVDREKARRATAALAEIHQHAAIGRPGRPLDQKILGQQAFAGAVRPHHPDIESAAFDLGEGDQIAARRPDRRAVFAGAEADPLPLAAVGA